MADPATEGAPVITAPARDERGRWLRGQSPNPKGRSSHRQEIAHLKPYQDAWPELVQIRLQHAREGCDHCLDRIEDRVLGKVRDAAEPTGDRRIQFLIVSGGSGGQERLEGAVDAFED